jgi:tellurite resistance protein TerC
MRALYFLLAGASARFGYLRPGLAVVLAFVGLKMLLADVLHIPVWVSLAVILGVLTAALLASRRGPVGDPLTEHATANR